MCLTVSSSQSVFSLSYMCLTVSSSQSILSLSYMCLTVSTSQCIFSLSYMCLTVSTSQCIFSLSYMCLTIKTNQTNNSSDVQWRLRHTWSEEREIISTICWVLLRDFIYYFPFLKITTFTFFWSDIYKNDAHIGDFQNLPRAILYADTTGWGSLPL